MVIKGRVVAGMSGCYHLNTRCWVSAHDAGTGAEVWRTHTIPARGEFGYDSWGDVPDEDRRGGSAWNSPSFDPELNLIFTGVGVPIPWGSVQRGTGDGDVLYTNSTLALDADTGEIVWYFQHIPNDEWDLDHPYARLVVETEVSPGDVAWRSGSITPGRRRKIVTGIPGKTGIVWALDAATGAFLWAQPTNRQNVVADIDAESRRVIVNQSLKFPQVGEPVFVCPSALGGINWQGTGYHPGTNVLYAPTNNVCMNLTLNEFRDRPGLHHGSARIAQEPAPDIDGQIGQFSAIDLTTGEPRWVYRQRAGIGGSVLTTGGGLVFVTDDARRFRAFDAATGDILWEQILNSSAGGFPVSYMHDGVQYIAIAAGGGINFRGLTPEIRQPGGGQHALRLPAALRRSGFQMTDDELESWTHARSTTTTSTQAGLPRPPGWPRPPPASTPSSPATRTRPANRPPGCSPDTCRPPPGCGHALPVEAETVIVLHMVASLGAVVAGLCVVVLKKSLLKCLWVGEALTN